MDTEKGYRDEDTLRELYVYEGLTQEELADRFDCSTSIVSRYIRRFGLSNRDTEVCPECGEEYAALGKHWNRSECSRPPLTERQKEIVTGLLMGDGYVGRKNDMASPSFSCSMVNKEFLEWVDMELGVLSTGVRLERDSESTRKLSADYSNVSFEESKARSLYRVQSRNHDDFESLIRWYRDGTKRFPRDLNLTPIVAKMWYVSDGGLMWDTRHDHVVASINAYNERDRPKVLHGLWSETPFSPSVTERGVIQFPKSERDEFLQWLGEPPNGFEYKWETDTHDGYVSSKQDSMAIDL